MSDFFISNVETHVVNTEAEAAKIIEDAKKETFYTLSKYTSECKEKKVKGEVADRYYKVTLTKVFNDIKNPVSHVRVTYEVE